MVIISVVPLSIQFEDSEVALYTSKLEMAKGPFESRKVTRSLSASRSGNLNIRL